MDAENAILALAALAQSTRLDVFRLLVRHEPEGLPAGEIAKALAVPHNTMSAHLGVLSRASLVRSERHSRTILYRVDLSTLEAVAMFLLQDCCAGKQDLHVSIIESLKLCCAPTKAQRVRADS